MTKKKVFKSYEEYIKTVSITKEVRRKSSKSYEIGYNIGAQRKRGKS